MKVTITKNKNGLGGYFWKVPVPGGSTSYHGYAFTLWGAKRVCKRIVKRITTPEKVIELDL